MFTKTFSRKNQIHPCNLNCGITEALWTTKSATAVCLLSAWNRGGISRIGLTKQGISEVIWEELHH